MEPVSTVWAGLGAITVSLRTALLLMVLAAALTFYLCVKAFRIDLPDPTDTFEPGFTQADGSKGLPLIPIAEKDAPPAPHIEPGKPFRRISVTVQPSAPDVQLVAPKPNPDGTCPVPEALQCPPVRVDLSLVQDEKGTYRTIASSPDGEVIGGMDLTFHDFVGPVKRNHALVLGNPKERAGAVVYSRSLTLFGKQVEAGAAAFSLPEDRFIPMIGAGTSW